MHTFPVHCSIHCLFETCMSRVLQIVMILFNCAHLEWLGDNQPTIFAYTCRVFNEFDLQSLINYCIALEEVLQGCICLLGCGNFHCC